MTNTQACLFGMYAAEGTNAFLQRENNRKKTEVYDGVKTIDYIKGM